MYNTDLPDDVTQPSGKPSRTLGLTLNAQTRPVKHTVAQQRFQSSTRVASTEIQLIAANPTRSYLLIQNTGGNDILLGFGAQPTTSGDNAIVLPASTQLDFPSGNVPMNEIYVISTGGSTFAVLEGSRSNG